MGNSGHASCIVRSDIDFAEKHSTGSYTVMSLLACIFLRHFLVLPVVPGEGQPVEVHRPHMHSLWYTSITTSTMHVSYCCHTSVSFPLPMCDWCRPGCAQGQKPTAIMTA